MQTSDSIEVDFCDDVGVLSEFIGNVFADRIEKKFKDNLFDMIADIMEYMISPDRKAGEPSHPEYVNEIQAGLLNKIFKVLKEDEGERKSLTLVLNVILSEEFLYFITGKLILKGNKCAESFVGGPGVELIFCFACLLNFKTIEDCHLHDPDVVGYIPGNNTLAILIEDPMLLIMASRNQIGGASDHTLSASNRGFSLRQSRKKRNLIHLFFFEMPKPPVVLVYSTRANNMEDYNAQVMIYQQEQQQQQEKRAAKRKSSSLVGKRKREKAGANGEG